MEGYEKRYTMWEGYRNAFAYLTDEQELALRRAMDAYAFDNRKMPNFAEPVLQVAWELLVANIDKSLKLSESGKAGRNKQIKSGPQGGPQATPQGGHSEEEKEEEIEIEKEKEKAANTPISKASVFVCKECGCKVSKSTSSPNWRCDVCYTIYTPNELNQLKRIRA